MQTTTGGAGRGISANDLSMLLVVLIWGGNFSIVKLAVFQIPPLAFTAIRFSVATVLLLLILRFYEGPVKLSSRLWWKMIWLGIVGNTLYQFFFIQGLAITTAGNSALLISTTPVLVALIGKFIGIEHLTRRAAFGIALAFLGIALVISARGLTVSRETLKGDLVTLVGALFWSIYTLGVRTVGNQISTLRVTALTMLTGTPGLVLLGLPGLLNLHWSSIHFKAWGGLVYAIVFALVVAYILWNTSVRKVGGSRTAIYACVTPLVATLIAWPMLGERPVPRQATGAGLIIIGVLLTRARRSTKEETVLSSAIQKEMHITG